MSTMINPRFLTWLGAKEKLIGYMTPYIPTTFIDFYEPFLGSASMFFHLAITNAIHKNSKVYLSDTNVDLILSYTGIKDHLYDTLFHLENHFRSNSRSYFRQERNRAYSDIAQSSANFIYINKASYGGINRTTKVGLLSSSFRDEPLKNFDSFDYWLASSYLQRASLSMSGFETSLATCKENDFVYLDPPYETFFAASKNSQYGGLFNSRQHDILEKICHSFTEKGVRFMLSNSNCETVRKRYSRYKIIELPIKYRFTKESLQHAKKTTELLITNY